MSQKSLLPEEPTIIGVENVMPAVEQLPSVIVPSETTPPGSPLATLREHAMLSGSPELMRQGLDHYKTMRDAFRQWIFSIMREGLHYGYSPGTTPKWCDERGNKCAEADAFGTLGKQNAVVPLTSWRPKKSLYAAGADLLCEALGARDTYESDHEGWVQAGSVAGMFCRRCSLYSRANGSFLADGTGIGSGEHLGHNASLKKADKRAKVAAVLNWLSLRDLFTQDVQDGADKPLVENPQQTPNAPTVPPRDNRLTKADVSTLVQDWKAEMQRQGKHPDDITPEMWARYVETHAKKKFNVKIAEEWTDGDRVRVKAALEAGL